MQQSIRHFPSRKEGLHIAQFCLKKTKKGDRATPVVLPRFCNQNDWRRIC